MAYALSFGSLLLAGGRLGDMFSRKWVFIAGLAGFAFALAGVAGPFAVVVTARALQGVSGAVLAPSAPGTLVSAFDDPRDRARAFGVFGSVAAGGSAVGLTLGGSSPLPRSSRRSTAPAAVSDVDGVSAATLKVRGAHPLTTRPLFELHAGRDAG